MIYVGKRFDGTIYGVWRNKQPDDADHFGVVKMDENDPEVADFLSRPASVYVDPKDAKLTELENRLTAVEAKVQPAAEEVKL